MLRRYSPLKPSRGTEIPVALRRQVLTRDNWSCVLATLGVPHEEVGGLELDHVRSSGALGKKSRTTADNLVSLCSIAHRLKTNNGRVLRPILLEYLAKVEPTAEHTHVEPVPGCDRCIAPPDPYTVRLVR